jgi:hypothetical protein
MFCLFFLSHSKYVFDSRLHNALDSHEATSERGVGTVDSMLRQPDAYFAAKNEHDYYRYRGQCRSIIRIHNSSFLNAGA